MMKNVAMIFWILIGNFMLAVGVCCFVVPHSLIMGGGTGIGIMLNAALGLEISTVVAVFNVITFIIGLIFLGKKFAATTLLSTIVYPVFLEVLQGVPALQNMTDDLMLASIFAGILVGGGVGLVMKMGASTGGMDIPPLVLNKKLGIPMNILVYLFDTAVLLMQMPFSEMEHILYGLVLVFFSSTVLNKMLELGDDKVQVMIISNLYQQIGTAILHELDLGSTYILIEGGMSGEQKKAVMTVLNKRHLKALQLTVQKIDPMAFMQVTNVATVSGRGFTLARHYQLEKNAKDAER